MTRKEKNDVVEKTLKAYKDYVLNLPERKEKEQKIKEFIDAVKCSLKEKRIGYMVFESDKSIWVSIGRDAILSSKLLKIISTLTYTVGLNLQGTITINITK
ncbi:hypothetical protein [Bacteroides sp. 519]|uniref:hypothetical protein n=1 Tax=Bacteroides sp. 519 TaxID=2302937 RepID=UPI0013CF462E|nr:hypothetical protein [Bacteroides sp. 519]NDV59326.1 hypothetical protein [Bacteroides sp. 519]